MVDHSSTPPNTALELTPLCGPKIVAILAVGISPTVFTVYQGGAAQRQAVGPLSYPISHSFW